jgi:agmatinase
VLAELPQVTKLVQVGIRDFSAGEYEAIRAQSPRVTTCFDEDLAALRLRGVALAPKLEALISELPEKVYVSFDIDGLDPTLCPATGTPVPGGLSFHEAWLLLDTLLKSGRRVVGFDLCEVSGTQEWDANVGARVLYRLIAIALRSRGVPL